MMNISKALLLALLMPTSLVITDVHATSAEDGIKVSGIVRVNYAYKDYDEASKDKLGDFTFDMAAIKFDGKLGDWGLASEYRFLDGWNMLRYGYGFYDVNPQWQLQLGVTQVPFGNPGFISNSFWFGVPYYLGFEDDYDLGVKAAYSSGAWNTEMAFFKNAEYAASNNQRYATDLYSGVVNGTEYFNEETNQLNLRQMYEITYAGGQTRLGGSVEFGQIYNSNTGNNGDRYAIALHMESSYNDWNLQLQVMQYEYDAADAVDNNKVAVSVYNYQYEIAAKAQAYSVNIAKTLNTGWGSIKLYNDFGMVTPDVDDDSYDTSYQNVTGVALAAGPTYTMIDFILGKNMYASTRDNSHVGLPEMGDSWDKRVNINFGYYF
ncbi:hypothetical protein [Shewanella algidipiscicola]|uniref:Outer membrane beta barrel protein n=1 Tax=Shewanella algidipiscicola TaxID=614070 RepID=A0ABQ4PMC5_9GAMM|nr:hypothetical protein [Shewanella algidipiscicola]GIU49390.1 outer membrane beta barrel protein [Shewanella algidipiscicola]